MKTIPVARATHVMPYLHFCQQHGLSAERSLKRFKLPTDYSEMYDIYLPQLASLGALKDISESQGVLDLAARVTTQLQLSDFGDNIYNAVKYSPSLLVAIRRLANIVQLEASTLSIEVKTYGNITWLLVQQPSGVGFDFSEWANITLLMQTVREFAGSNWLPAEVKLMSVQRELVIAQQYFPDSRIFWHPNEAGISIPANFLGLSQTADSIKGAREITLPGDLPSELGLLETVRGLIAAYLPMGGLPIESLAEMAGVSSRSLQRWFKKQGLSYSELLDQTRFERAAHILKNTDIKALEIALEVGYSDASHFTRSFKRITNMTPREYRREFRDQ